MTQARTSSGLNGQIDQHLGDGSGTSKDKGSDGSAIDVIGASGVLSGDKRSYFASEARRLFHVK